eukprot:NODE_720_length_1238_cov_110.954095_g680_i0.p1 GENE.NODE_720_length_1238_cov_110.954095_g680_i0~~NODE_720_length_1238_cov_110.954095_g680_i0.p1  ORF type:complete len:174 (-),score=22.25 NODE_720_length_1238_cov_110.954095_g680_i0:655-1176(-)
MPLACSPSKEYSERRRGSNGGGRERCRCPQLTSQLESAENSNTQLRSLVDRYKAQNDELAQALQAKEKQYLDPCSTELMLEMNAELLSLKRQLSEHIQEIASLKIELHKAKVQTPATESGGVTQILPDEPVLPAMGSMLQHTAGCSGELVKLGQIEDALALYNTAVEACTQLC